LRLQAEDTDLDTTLDAYSYPRLEADPTLEFKVNQSGPLDFPLGFRAAPRNFSDFRHPDHSTKARRRPGAML